MPLLIILAAVLLIIFALAYKLFLHSPTVDKAVKEISDENYVAAKKEPRQVIRDIEANKQQLQNQVKDNEKLAERAEKQNKAINSYLGKQEDVPSDESKE